MDCGDGYAVGSGVEGSLGTVILGEPFVKDAVPVEGNGDLARNTKRFLRFSPLHGVHDGNLGERKGAGVQQGPDLLGDVIYDLPGAGELLEGRTGTA